MQETETCIFCDSFLKTPQQCESCKNSFCLECFLYSFIREKKCPFGCETYLPKSNTELENQLPKELSCPHCNQVFKINDLTNNAVILPLTKTTNYKMKTGLRYNLIFKLRNINPFF